MSKWTQFVKKHYHTEHAKNKSYTFRQALQDAAKVYKKSATTETNSVKTPKNKTSRRKKKTEMTRRRKN